MSPVHILACEVSRSVLRRLAGGVGWGDVTDMECSEAWWSGDHARTSPSKTDTDPTSRRQDARLVVVINSLEYRLAIELACERR